MDISKALRELHEERQRIDRAIKRLEARLAQFQPRAAKKRRGRKGMGPEERVRVSERMRAWWAKKRGKADAPDCPTEHGCPPYPAAYMVRGEPVPKS